MSDKLHDRKGMKTDINLFSRIMHELVVCATEYFPVTRKDGMRNDEVARRAAIIISYFSVVGADPVSRRGLGVQKSKIFSTMAG